LEISELRSSRAKVTGGAETRRSRPADTLQLGNQRSGAKFWLGNQRPAAKHALKPFIKLIDILKWPFAQAIYQQTAGPT
jgi:hypothetical protein